MNAIPHWCHCSSTVCTNRHFLINQLIYAFSLPLLSVDDSLDTRSDGDLTNLYSFDGHDRKRPKTEPKATTQSSEDAVKDLDHGSVDDMLDEISANDQQVKEEPPNESETGNFIRDEEKENSNLVTMRNKFAISSAQKRPRFDINATKVEVKSR